MYQSIDVQRRFVQERIAQNVNDAAELRRSGAPAPSIRRSIGRSIISIGARVAAEPSLELARSR